MTIHNKYNQWVANPEDSIRNMYVYKNIWNGISKGKYKFSFHLWVGMWVRKK